ncbi:MAG: hypothetical protein ACR2P0_08180 [Acidimicrobiales bacterium]
MTNGLRWARRTWVVAAAVMFFVAFASLGHAWTEGRTVGGLPDCFGCDGQYRLSPGQAASLQDIGLSPDWHAAFISIRLVLVVATALTVSALLWRRARTWAPFFLAWFLLTSLLVTAFSGDVADRVPGWLGLPLFILFASAIFSFFGLLLVFPDYRSARWVGGLCLAVVALFFFTIVTDNVGWLWDYAVYVGAALAVVGLGLQVTRIARSRDRTARDLLLLTVAMMIVFMTLMFSTDSEYLSENVMGIGGSRTGLGSLAWRIGFETLTMAVPLTYGLAVLWILVRRGHWDMDVQLKSSVGYAALTTLLVMGYFSVVAVVQAIVNNVSGAEGDTFALMVSTALIAAAILPLRSRLQRLVDRLFDRRRNDVDRLVETFETSVVRDARPDDVAGALLTAVDDVFHPEHSELWLFPETRA